MSQSFDSCPSSLPPDRENVRSLLEPYTNALNLPLAACHGFLLPSARLVRYLLNKLFSHWLRVQSRFNLSLVSVLEQLEQRIDVLEKTEQEIRRFTMQLQSAVMRNTAALPGWRAEPLRESFRRWTDHGSTGEALPAAENPLAIENTTSPFVQTHLPAPPARLLLVATSGNRANEWKELGYQVVTTEYREHRSDGALLQEHTFDAIVVVSQSITAQSAAALSRLLRRGGRLLALMPRDHLDAPSRSEAALGNFRIIERFYVVRVGNVGSLTPDSERAGQAEGDAICLVALEKTEAIRAIYDDV